LIILVTVLFLAAGCGKHTKPAEQAPAPPEPQHQPVASVQEVSAADRTEEEQSSSCRDEQTIRKSEHGRAACFHLQPATTITKVIKREVPGKNTKSAKASSKGEKKAAAPHMVTETKVVRTTGRCQPQCVMYVRCRTGFATCRLGDTSPVQWFACAAKNGATSPHPHIGSVLALAAHAGHNMPTGHLLYVEEAKKQGNGTWRLRTSHTNYDRKCHLDQDAMVLFDPKRMTASFETGPWARWAKDMKTLGFILR